MKEGGDAAFNSEKSELAIQCVCCYFYAKGIALFPSWHFGW
jgi:hypothetical protein